MRIIFYSSELIPIVIFQDIAEAAEVMGVSKSKIDYDLNILDGNPHYNHLPEKPNRVANYDGLRFYLYKENSNKINEHHYM